MALYQYVQEIYFCSWCQQSSLLCGLKTVAHFKAALQAATLCVVFTAWAQAITKALPRGPHAEKAARPAPDWLHTQARTRPPRPLPRLHSRPRLSAGLPLLEKGACRLFFTLIQSSVLFHSLPFPIPCAEQRSPPPPSTLRDLTLAWAGPYGKTAPFSCIASCVFYHSKEIKPYLSPSVWLFALSDLFTCQLSSRHSWWTV